MVQIGLAIIASLTSLGVAYISVIAKQTKNIVNGKSDELLARVKLLEELLEWHKLPPRERPLPAPSDRDDEQG